ncbi:hypothetical protein BDD14_3091 [Edaphobacter modestus]|uniref:Uncharacterized protein n=1 Tax=Edaphobacter modestus TaxID=388466 RepID=A0A4V2G4M7_9BACT|nr:hypothetical protein BDD14_3091 [Edaphobacter modestus]
MEFHELPKWNAQKDMRARRHRRTPIAIAEKGCVFRINCSRTNMVAIYSDSRMV